MKLYLWTAGWGWWLVGIGYKTKWFFGLSIAQDKTDIVEQPCRDEYHRRLSATDIHQGEKQWQ